MNEYGGVPKLLRRPLRAQRRRVSLRRKLLLACVGLAAVLCVFLLSCYWRTDIRTPALPTAQPEKGGKLPRSTASLPQNSQHFTSPTVTKASAQAIATTNVATTSAKEADVSRGNVQVPWVVDTPSADATVGASRSAFKSLVGSHTPGTAWRDPDTKNIVALSKCGTVAYVTPTNAVRHHRADYRKWESIYQPLDSYKIPAWAAPEDRNTLQHASIFTSIASFRD
ncbi:hypothetical protein ABL78_8347, partial [Leptomonas seymouri]